MRQTVVLWPFSGKPLYIAAAHLFHGETSWERKRPRGDSFIRRRARRGLMAASQGQQKATSARPGANPGSFDFNLS